jgi:hypothetical protein
MARIEPKVILTDCPKCNQPVGVSRKELDGRRIFCGRCFLWFKLKKKLGGW